MEWNGMEWKRGSVVVRGVGEMFVEWRVDTVGFWMDAGWGVGA